MEISRETAFSVYAGASVSLIVILFSFIFNNYSFILHPDLKFITLIIAITLLTVIFKIIMDKMGIDFMISDGIALAAIFIIHLILRATLNTTYEMELMIFNYFVYTLTGSVILKYFK